MLALCITISNTPDLMAQVSSQDETTNKILSELNDLHKSVDQQGVRLDAVSKQEDPLKILSVAIPALVALVVAIGGWLLTYKILKATQWHQERERMATQRHQEQLNAWCEIA